jgi:hypothetical protein
MQLRLFFNKIQNNLYQLTIFWTSIVKGPKIIFQVPTTVPQLKKKQLKKISMGSKSPHATYCVTRFGRA